MERKEKLKKEKGAMNPHTEQGGEKMLVIGHRYARLARKGSCTRICTYTDTHGHVAMSVHTFCLLPSMVIDPHILRLHTYDGQP